MQCGHFTLFFIFFHKLIAMRFQWRYDKMFDKKIKNFTVRISQKMYDDLDRNSRKYDLTKSEIIRMSIETYLMDWR